MAVRAYEMKKRREDERRLVVQEKLYQQWREGLDDVRTQDSKVVELKTIAARDGQLVEKAEIKQKEMEDDKLYDKIWHEGYLAKVEREKQEKELKAERNAMQKRTLAMQLDMKEQVATEKKETLEIERQDMLKLWARQEVEASEKVAREKAFAREERVKMDEFAKIQQRQQELAEREEQQQDKDFIAGVIAREKHLEMQEQSEKTKAKQKALEFTEALKIEMARKAESEEQLVRLQQEESERQWAKRYARWEKEEVARRQLMEEVYTDRAKQVSLKNDMRENIMAGVQEDRRRIDAEVHRLDAINEEQEKAESLMRLKQQEELFKQMDFKQVQAHRAKQQNAIEARQAAIAEEKLRRAMEVEKKKASEIMNKVQENRKKA